MSDSVNGVTFTRGTAERGRALADELRGGSGEPGARQPGAAMTEALLQDAILAYARLLGWRTHHAWISVNSGAGYPDLTLVRSGRIVFAELKGPRGKVSPAQAAWLDDLQGCPGVEAFLWTPQEWDDGTIERVLR